MILNLLIGLPGDRPGGLVLTLVCFFASGAGALMVGFVYAVICVALREQVLSSRPPSGLVGAYRLSSWCTYSRMYIFVHDPSCRPASP